jgi:hypothetical protein
MMGLSSALAYPSVKTLSMTSSQTSRLLDNNDKKHQIEETDKA